MFHMLFMSDRIKLSSSLATASSITSFFLLQTWSTKSINYKYVRNIHCACICISIRVFIEYLMMNKILYRPNSFSKVRKKMYWKKLVPEFFESACDVTTLVYFYLADKSEYIYIMRYMNIICNEYKPLLKQYLSTLIGLTHSVTHTRLIEQQNP